MKIEVNTISDDFGKREKVGKFFEFGWKGSTLVVQNVCSGTPECR